MAKVNRWPYGMGWIKATFYCSLGAGGELNRGELYINASGLWGNNGGKWGGYLPRIRSVCMPE